MIGAGRTTRMLAVLLAAGLLAGLTAGRAAEGGPAAPAAGSGRDTTLKEQAEELRRRLEQSREQVEQAERRESDVLTALDRLEREVRAGRRRMAELEAQLAELEGQIESTQAAAADLEERLAANGRYVARRLVAWYKLKRLGEIHLLATAEDITGFLRRRDGLRRVLVYDRLQRQQLLDDRAELEQVRRRLDERRQAHRERIAEKQRRLEELAAKRRAHAELLAGVRRDKRLRLAAVSALQAAAERLDERIAALSRRPVPPEGPGGVDAVPFAALKGLLDLPVAGNIVSRFGPDRNPRLGVTGFRSGIDIRTDRGEPVRAVSAGKVLFADWFKGYGNMMIIDHGAHYYTVYAHVEEMFKSVGEQVRAGEVIATVGDTGSLEGPRLHFEVRHHGKPVDPAEWFK